MEKELSPVHIQQSVETILLLTGYARGETTLPTSDVELGHDYKEAVTQYAQYCMEAYHDPQLANLLFQYGYVENEQICVARPDYRKECVYLGRDNEGKPQLYFTVLNTRETELSDALTAEEFRQKIIDTYGIDEINPWAFRELNERYGDGSGYDLYHAASRRLKPEDLLDSNLLRSLIYRTASVFGGVRIRIMREKVGAVNEDKIRERVNAFVKANEILRNTFAVE